MTVDDEIARAGSRLAAVPVTVPDLERLVAHHRRRRRTVAVGGLVVLLVVAAAAGISHDRNARRVSTQTAGTGPTPTGAPIGLAQEGVWPGDGRRFTSADEMADVFARDVLGWEEADVVVDPAEPNSPTGLTISDGADRSVRAVVAPLRGAWTIMQIGHGAGPARPDGARTRITIPTGPRGTVSARWWALADGREITGIHPEPTGSLVVPIAIDQLGSLLVVYLDDHQVALGAIGGGYASPNANPPTTPVTDPGK
jgi:hypothetical protein